MPLELARKREARNVERIDDCKMGIMKERDL